MTVAHGNDAVEPTVFLGRCFKVRRHAHVVFGRTDVLTAREPVHDLFWAVAHTEISHADQGAVIGLHHQPHIYGDCAVTPQRLPVAAAGDDLAAQPLAFETAAGDFANAPVIAWRCADHTGRFDLDMEYQQRLVAQHAYLSRQ